VHFLCLSCFKCTDDFEGPSPHNANLALKGMVGLGAWANLLDQAGDPVLAATYNNYASTFLNDWLSLGLSVCQRLLCLILLIFFLLLLLLLLLHSQRW
jgi:hypothetical protein